MLIEDGVGADLLRAGMAVLLPGQPAGDEKFLLDEQGIRQLVALSDVNLLLDAGILMPTD